jgi:hypothetical protein
MEPYELETLTEDGRDFERVIELLETNPLLLRTYYYFKHCARTMRRLKEEINEQRTTAENLSEQLREMGIDEVLREVIVRRRRRNMRLTRFGPANRTSPQSPTTNFHTAPESIVRPDNPAPSITTEDSADQLFAATPRVGPGSSPSIPIIIVESSDESSGSTSSSRAATRRQRRPNPIRTAGRYQRQQRTGLPFEENSLNLESSI